MSQSTPNDDRSQLVRDAVDRGLTLAEKNGPAQGPAVLDQVADSLDELHSYREHLERTAELQGEAGKEIAADAAGDPTLQDRHALDAFTGAAERRNDQLEHSAETELAQLDQTDDVLAAVESYASVPWASIDGAKYTHAEVEQILDDALRNQDLPTLREAGARPQTVRAERRGLSRETPNLRDAIKHHAAALEKAAPSHGTADTPDRHRSR